MNKLSKLIILVFSISLFGCLGIFIYAGSGDNTSGFAWSNMENPGDPTIGWVSFNSTTGGGGSDYGVDISLSTGYLSGHAFYDADDPNTAVHEHGWISFNRSETGAPPSGEYDPCSGGECIAKYNSETDELTGWMRVLANDSDWDGWIRFCDSSISECSGFEARIDASGDWHGFAWSDMIVGWLSFNSTDPGAGGGSAYKVTSVLNNPPIASNLNVVKGDYCSSPPVHFFSWIYTDPEGDDESQFQFQVDNDSGFGSPEVDQTVTGTWSSGDSNDQTVIVVESPVPNQIGYNDTYYWRVKVWDSWPAESVWVEGSSFMTEPHRYPSIGFNWSPQEPSQEENVLFADQSTVYGGATKSAWSWTFVGGNPATSNEQNPTIQFTTTGDQLITLGVRDSDGFYCQTSRTISVQIKLPGWKEILPW